jgi:hypothetical protein
MKTPTTTTPTTTNRITFSPWMQGHFKELFSGITKGRLIWLAYQLIRKIDNVYANEVFNELKRRVAQSRADESLGDEPAIICYVTEVENPSEGKN